jgi:hypothetical protein
MTTCSPSSPTRSAARRPRSTAWWRPTRCSPMAASGWSRRWSTASRTATGAPSTATTSGSAPIASWPRSIPGMGPRIVSNRERVIDPVTAYQLTSMMQGVVQRGTAAGTVGACGHSRRTGRQDRHHQRRARRVVRGLLLDHRGGLLHRLRPAPQPRARRLGRRHVRPGLRRVHARGGAGIRRRALRGAAGGRVLPDRPLFRAAPAGRQRRRTRGLRAVPRGRGAVRGAPGGDRRRLGHGLGPADVRARRGRRRGRGLDPAGRCDHRAGGDDGAHLRRGHGRVPTGTGFGTLSAGGLY